MSPRQGTGLRKRKNGWGYEIMIKGRTFSGACPTTNKREAIKWVDDLRRRLRATESVEDAIAMRQEMVGGSNDIFLTDIWSEYLSRPQRRQRKQQTTNDLAFVVDDFVSWMARNYSDVSRVSQVAHTHAMAYAAELDQLGPASREFRRPLSATRRNRFIAALSMIWTAILPRENRRLNPWADVPRARGHIHPVRSFTDGEILTLLDQTDGPMRYLFTIGIFTGMRLGDVCTLRGEEVDLESMWIERKTRKTGSLAAIPVLKPLADFLGSWGVRPGHLCPYAAEMYIRNRSTISARIQRCFAELGIQTRETSEDGKDRTVVSFHSCRHTFITLAARARVPLPVIQGAVGHMTQEMTLRYASHFNRRQVQEMFRPAELLLPGGCRKDLRGHIIGLVKGLPEGDLPAVAEFIRAFNSPSSEDDRPADGFAARLLSEGPPAAS